MLRKLEHRRSNTDTMKAAREKMGELFDDVAKEALEEELEVEGPLAKLMSKD